MSADTAQLLAQSEPVLKKYGVQRAALFGSRARDDARPTSDTDIVVSFHHPISLFRFVGLERELQDAIGTPVDLVSEKSLSPYLKDSILREAIVFYEG